jgi:hypothetical protein
MSERVITFDNPDTVSRVVKHMLAANQGRGMSLAEFVSQMENPERAYGWSALNAFFEAEENNRLGRHESRTLPVSISKPAQDIKDLYLGQEEVSAL